MAYTLHSSPVALILLAMAYSKKWEAGGGRDVKTVFYELTMVSHTHKTLSHNAHTWQREGERERERERESTYKFLFTYPNSLSFNLNLFDRLATDYLYNSHTVCSTVCLSVSTWYTHIVGILVYTVHCTVGRKILRTLHVGRCCPFYKLLFSRETMLVCLTNCFNWIISVCLSELGTRDNCRSNATMFEG